MIIRCSSPIGSRKKLLFQRATSKFFLLNSNGYSDVFDISSSEDFFLVTNINFILANGYFPVVNGLVKRKARAWKQNFEFSQLEINHCPRRKRRKRESLVSDRNLYATKDENQVQTKFKMNIPVKIDLFFYLFFFIFSNSV